MAKMKAGQRKSAATKTATKRRASAQTVTKAPRKRKTTAQTARKRKSAAERKPVDSPVLTKRAAKKTPSGKSLGRPRVAGTAELELMFRRDRDAREIFEFLGVKTLKELEAYSPDEILERLTEPMIRTVGRIRKALAMNNRCLSGDQKFALAFKKQLS